MLNYFPAFQFHKGAIRTYMEYKQRVNVSSFQFHKGAIRTIFEVHSLK